MTRAEQVALCRQCTNRDFDPAKGIICGLTNDIASFISTCKDYSEDIAAKQQVKNFTYSSPTAELPNLASQSKRFINLIIDFLAIIAFSFFLGIIIAFVNPQLIDSIPEILITLLINLSFYCFFEIVFKQTPGKMITGTRVVAEDGSEATAGQVFGRSLCRFIPFEPFSFLGDGPGWHDTITATRVIDLSINVNKETEIPLE